MKLPLRAHAPAMLALLSLVGTSFIGCGGAPAHPPAAPESRYITPTPALDGDALRHFGRDTNGLVLIDDLRPYAEAVWRSAAVRAINPDAGSTDDPGWAWIPTQVAVGWSDDGVRSIDRLVRLYLTGALALAASDPACTADGTERGRILKALVTEATDLDFGGLTVGVRFRTEAYAAEALTALAAGTSQLAPALMGGLTVHGSQDALDVVLAMPPMWPPEATVGALQAVGIGRPEDDLTPLASALATARMAARVERDGAWVILRLGARSAAPPLTPTDLELPLPPAQAAPRPLIASWLDMQPWKVAVAGWDAIWQAWRPTATGRQLIVMDAANDGQLLDLETIARRAAEQGRASMLRVDVSGSDLHISVVDRDMPSPTPLPLTADGLLRWLPADAPAMGANNQDDLGRLMADALWSIEDRLARRSLREEFSDDGDGEYSALSASYYRHFAELRRLILEERAHPFAAPYAWAMTAPVGAAPRLLLVSAVEPGRSIPYAERLAKLALRPAGSGPFAGIRARLEPADLGLGLETFVVRFSETSTPSAAAGDAQTFAFGDVRPHIFEHDGAFVFSTDIELSRRALARDRTTSPLADERASSTWRIEPDALTVPLATMADAMEMDPGERAAMLTVLGTFAGAEWTSRFEGPNRISRAVMRFVDTPATGSAE